MEALLLASQAVESGAWKEDEEVSFNSLKHVKPRPEELAAAKHKRGMLSLISWYERLNEFIDFKNQYGHGNVPQKYDPNPRLGFWVNNQRGDMKAYSDGKPSQMTRWKMDRLSEAGFVWAKPRGQSCWQHRFEELSVFKAIHGHCNVPTKFKENTALGRWVTAQRRYYDTYKKGKKICIDEHEMEQRIKKLEALGFVWRKIAKNKLLGQQQHQGQPGLHHPSDDDTEDDDDDGSRSHSSAGLSASSDHGAIATATIVTTTTAESPHHHPFYQISMDQQTPENGSGTIEAHQETATVTSASDVSDSGEEDSRVADNVYSNNITMIRTTTNNIINTNSLLAQPNTHQMLSFHTMDMKTGLRTGISQTIGTESLMKLNTQRRDKNTKTSLKQKRRSLPTSQNAAAKRRRQA